MFDDFAIQDCLNSLANFRSGEELNTKPNVYQRAESCINLYKPAWSCINESAIAVFRNALPFAE